MDLRDQFAVRFAAALVGALTDPELIAKRAYDLADAMLSERDRRIDADEQRAIMAEPFMGQSATSFAPHPPLLDEPMPFEDDEDSEPPYDPNWHSQPVVKPDAIRSAALDVTRPGLARTQPEAVESRPLETKTA